LRRCEGDGDHDADIRRDGDGQPPADAARLHPASASQSDARPDNRNDGRQKRQQEHEVE
jgi:hypothetical protein